MYFYKCIVIDHCRRSDYKYTDTCRLTIIVSLMRVEWTYLLWILTLKSLDLPPETTRKIL